MHGSRAAELEDRGYRRERVQEAEGAVVAAVGDVAQLVAHMANAPPPPLAHLNSLRTATNNSYYHLDEQLIKLLNSCHHTPINSLTTAG